MRYNNIKFEFIQNIKLLTFSQCRRISQKKGSSDMIGPPDHISNIRTVKYAVRENETPLELRLREHREELQAWNKKFWTIHNLSFIDQKKKHENSLSEKNSPENQNLEADEMSTFYKKFLDENWKTHMKYLFEWYRKHIFVTYLHAKVLLHNLIRRK